MINYFYIFYFYIFHIYYFFSLHYRKKKREILNIIREREREKKIGNKEKLSKKSAKVERERFKNENKVFEKIEN
jgi:hypothetical protein